MVKINLDGYSQDLMRQAKETLEATRTRRQVNFDRESLSEKVEQVTHEPTWARAIAKGSELDVMKVYKGVQELSRKDTGEDLFTLSRQIMSLMLVLENVDPEEEQASYLATVHSLVKETQGYATTLARHVESAVKRVPVWNGSALVLSPLYLPSKMSVENGVDTFEVHVGRKGAGFSVFTNKGKPEGVEDVLDSTDRDFFTEPEEQADYFNLVKEMDKPGSSSKGRNLTLYTARPMKDRAMYLRGTLPPGIYMTSDLDTAEGIAHELGNREVRDLWKVVINEIYLIQTLNAGRVRDYQVAGSKPVQAVKMELLAEGQALRVASEWLRIKALV